MKITTPGEYPVGLDTPMEIAIGHLRAHVSRTTKDWIVEYEYNQDRYVRSAEQEKVRTRTFLSETGARLSVVPACADRGIVAKPVDSLHIPPGERVTVFMSSPLWVQFFVADPAELLADLPTEIMSDTWFGPNTTEGELCYSNATHARVFMENLLNRPERLITPTTFINKGADVLTVDRLNLPLPLLSLYQSGDRYWTQEIVISREVALDEAGVDFRAEPPQFVEDASLVNGPRTVEADSTVTRAMAMLFR